MRIPRLRLTARRLMLVVAIAAVSKHVGFQDVAAVALLHWPSPSYQTDDNTYRKVAASKLNVARRMGSSALLILLANSLQGSKCI
jgi:hypothetical protein